LKRHQKGQKKGKLQHLTVLLRVELRLLNCERPGSQSPQVKMAQVRAVSIADSLGTQNQCAAFGKATNRKEFSSLRQLDFNQVALVADVGLLLTADIVAVSLVDVGLSTDHSSEVEQDTADADPTLVHFRVHHHLLWIFNTRNTHLNHHSNNNNNSNNNNSSNSKGRNNSSTLMSLNNYNNNNKTLEWGLSVTSRVRETRSGCPPTAQCEQPVAFLIQMYRSTPNRKINCTKCRI
jgi:hypothetical protein